MVLEGNRSAGARTGETDLKVNGGAQLAWKLDYASTKGSKA